MTIDPDDFRRNFALLSDASLLATKRQDLIPVAQQCYDEELASRGLTARTPVAAAMAEERDTESETESQEEAVIDDPPVTIATYAIAEEASLARGLLDSAGIPVNLTGENTGLGGYQLRLMVPAGYEEAAFEVLESEISEEELAAQAEAAGMLETEEEDEDAREP